MENSSKSITSVTFVCRTDREADRMRDAVRQYGRVLKSRGQDLRNYAPANGEEAGFGWGAVEQAVRDMGQDSTTHMPARMAGAIMDALSHLADHTPDHAKRRGANWTAARLEILMMGGK